ncbi:MAG: hypothetical protein AB7S75_01765 [Desulfococcaceae bacterium]
MKVFIGSIAFVISVIVAKIVLILIVSPVLVIPSISNSSISGGICMGIAVIAGICSGIFCFKRIFRYLNKEIPKILK